MSTNTHTKTDRSVALITGASARVGQAIACEFAARGFDLVLTWNTTSPDETITHVREIDTNIDVRAHKVDLSDCDATQAWAIEHAKECIRLDVLVHNASVYQQTPLEDASFVAADLHWRVNVMSPMLISSAFTPLLRTSTLPGGGSIVCMCDIHAMGLPRAHHIAYSMSKAALTEMVRSLAVDCAPNIRVNGVSPGVVAWPMTGPDSDPEMQKRYLSRVPLARAGTPTDAAKAVGWLACDATYITGQIIPVDGGRSLK